MAPNRNYKDIVPRWEKPEVSRRKKLLRASIHVLSWIGIGVVYYMIFSFFFDTPLEYRMKQSTKLLSQEYKAISQRYDTVERVLENVIARDRQVFKILFESEPYNFEADFEQKRWATHESLLEKSNTELADLYQNKLNNLQKNIGKESVEQAKLEEGAQEMGNKLNYIPAIQPVINPDLTLLTASYGMRIHPFYRTLTAHQGVDYTVPEGSRVFATADGRVSDVLTRNTSSGNTVVINHGNGYETSYAHLGKIYVKKGQTVSRGDIIAQSGNTGLSLAPHLHYEIRHNNMRVDPIHYFFMELDYNDYQKIIRIAQSGMQSFD